MNFQQLHEQLRLELVRRISRGALSGSLLSRQTGLRTAHISNFLHSKRRLSLNALDSVLAAQSLTAEDLLSASREYLRSKKDLSQASRVPLVSDYVAMHEAQIREKSVSEMIPLPAEYLAHLQTRRTPGRRAWERFVAVRTDPTVTKSMMPAIRPHSILIIDRHYNSLTPYRPPAPNIYAVQHGAKLLFRYVAFQKNCLILRPHDIQYPVDLVELSAEESPGRFIVGRVCASIAEV
jgi:hypothetical protein